MTGEGNFYNQIFAVLICEKFGFKVDIDTINEITKEILPEHNHNLILSICDGLIGYQVKSGEPFVGIPFTHLGKTNCSILAADEDNSHIKIFISNLTISTTAQTIYLPELGGYLKHTQ